MRVHFTMYVPGFGLVAGFFCERAGKYIAPDGCLGEWRENTLAALYRKIAEVRGGAIG